MVKIYQIDAFTRQLFGGNPAAVVPLEKWLDDKTLQAVAMENNLAETAYIVPVESSSEKCSYELRWFTPVTEVALCGHATLATAHVLVHHLGETAKQINFITRQSGTLTVSRQDNDQFAMSFPSIAVDKSDDYDLVSAAIGATPESLLKGSYSADEFDYVAVFDSSKQLEKLEISNTEFKALRSRGVIVTALCANDEYDFFSRYFAPNSGIDEDPVTGSAHCLLAPYWAGVLGRSILKARQLSPRGGELGCEVQGDRTVLTGCCVDYLQGEIRLE